MTSDENTTHSLCTFPVTKAKEAMKMEHCLSLGQMTQNNHRRDDNAYTVKMLLTRKKKEKKKNNHKLHKFIIACKATPIPFCPPPWKSHNQNKQVLEMGRIYCCVEGPFYFVGKKRWSRSTFVKWAFLPALTGKRLD